MSKLSELVTALAAAEQLEVLPDKETVIARLQAQLNAELRRLAERETCADCGQFTPIEHLRGYVPERMWCPSCFERHKEPTCSARPLVVIGGRRP